MAKGVTAIRFLYLNPGTCQGWDDGTPFGISRPSAR
jgi:hypothetical protein